MQLHSKIALAAVAVALTACSTNGQSVSPTVSQANLNNDKLQFAVGTANIGTTGTIGLNTVATFRQPNGLNAVNVSTPTITGPTGFAVPNAQNSEPGTTAGSDAGTNHISGDPQSFAQPGTHTFGQSGGVFSFGFGPFNAGNVGGSPYAGNPPLYPLPFYGTGAVETTAGGNQLRYVGGPPAYPFFNDGTFPAGFEGYSQGFIDFAATPVAGTYTLSVLVATANAGAPTFTAAATLRNMTPLPSIAAPTFTADGAGGGSGTVTVPPDPRIIETMVYVVDVSSKTYFSVGPLRGTGTLPYTLPRNLGACTGSGCQNGSKASRSIASGDTYLVYATTYDWPMFEGSPPGNTSIAPVITGSNGQADVSTSAYFTNTYRAK